MHLSAWLVLSMRSGHFTSLCMVPIYAYDESLMDGEAFSGKPSKHCSVGMEIAYGKNHQGEGA